MVNLSQRGRAGLQFLGSLQHFSSGTLRPQARTDFETDPDGAALMARPASGSNAPWPERIAEARAVAERSLKYRQERFYQGYVARENFRRAIPAVEERRAAFEAQKVSLPADAAATLELDPSVVMPDYYRDVAWHCSPGGWDGYDLASQAIAQGVTRYVFSRGGYAAVEVDEDIREQRRRVLRQLPKTRYGRIYEAGCGPGVTLLLAHERFPDAELIGSDLSPGLLKNAHANAVRLGIPVAFKQRDARATREPDSSVDAVIFYALMHEMPVDVGIDVIREAFRILKPGGDLLINDPPPFAAVDPLQAVLLDWETENRGEPYFTETCSIQWSDVLRDVGFAEIEGYGLGPRGYPWINRGTKPV